MKNILLTLVVMAAGAFAGWWFFVKKKKDTGDDKGEESPAPETYASKINLDDLKSNLKSTGGYYVMYQLGHIQGRTVKEAVKNGVNVAIADAAKGENTHKITPATKKILTQTITDYLDKGWTPYNSIKQGIQAVENEIKKI